MLRESTLEIIVEELREAVPSITNVAELRAYAQNFPYPRAGQIILQALDYLSEPKVIDRKRDGKKIYQHVMLGYGRRLRGDESLRPQSGWTSDNLPCRDILIAIGMFAEQWAKSNELGAHEKISNKKLFGIEEPQELVYKFLNLLSDELRKHL